MAKLQQTPFLQFVTEVKTKIQQARLTALKAVNHQLIDLNWTTYSRTTRKTWLGKIGG